jgi:hypothetical protein
VTTDWYLDARLVALRRELVEAVNAWNEVAPEPSSLAPLTDEQRETMQRCLKADEAYYEAWKSFLWLRRQTRPRL